MSENVTEKKLNANQRRAIESLLTTGNKNAAAAAAGVSRKTLYRWMKEPLFIEAMREAEADAMTALSRDLVGLGAAAAAAFRDALDPGQKITIRLRAAEGVADRAPKLRELVDLEARFGELEKAAAERAARGA